MEAALSPKPESIRNLTRRYHGLRGYQQLSLGAVADHRALVRRFRDMRLEGANARG
jgi:hypothetical protein